LYVGEVLFMLFLMAGLRGVFFNRSAMGGVEKVFSHEEE